MKLTTALASFFLLAGFSAAAPIVEVDKREAEAHPTPQIMGSFTVIKTTNETCDQLWQASPEYSLCLWTTISTTECLVDCCFFTPCLKRDADAHPESINNLEKREADPTPQILLGFTFSKPANETCYQVQQASYPSTSGCILTQISSTECSVDCGFVKRDAYAKPEPKPIAALDGKIEQRAAADVNERAVVDQVEKRQYATTTPASLYPGGVCPTMLQIDENCYVFPLSPPSTTECGMACVYLKREAISGADEVEA